MFEWSRLAALYMVARLYVHACMQARQLFDDLRRRLLQTEDPTEQQQYKVRARCAARMRGK